MLYDLLFAIWFLLPAAAANVVPILVAPMPGLRHWDWPMDFGREWHGRRVLGSHKTWRGFISAIIAGALVFWLQHEIILHWAWLRDLANGYDDYMNLPWVLGALLGAGAIGGDAIKSFFKRRANVPAGQSWIPFDQLDYIVGAILVSLPFTVLPIAVYIWMLVFWFGVHVGASYLGWLLHLKEQPI